MFPHNQLMITSNNTTGNILIGNTLTLVWLLVRIHEELLMSWNFLHTVGSSVYTERCKKTTTKKLDMVNNCTHLG